MADLENGATNLFEEFFAPKSHPRDETADVGRDVNNADDPNYVNKNLPSGNALIAEVSNHDVDNGILAQTKVSGILSDSNSPVSLPDSVTRNNIENLKKKADSSNNSTLKKTDNRTENTNADAQTSAVNNSKNAAMKSDSKPSGKQKKAISFPKDTYISGYFEPPDPWKNAPAWTTDELVAAYRKSCEVHGTKPILKLIQQLQTISSPGKREEQLSLKGEKLDQKQCECIEEILRRVQFKLIDLEASHLDDECAVALFDMIEYYESACQLNIAFNKNIQARAWQACSRLVRRTPSLTYLDMRNCDLSDRTIPIFGRALKLGCHLTILHMENMNLSGRPLIILVAALKMNETLQELFLAENKLTSTDGVQLGNLLRYNHKLSLLDLRNNHLQEVGTSHICDGLKEQQSAGCGLHTLVLWNNYITYQAMPALGRALAVSGSLETLNIGHNAITNEGVHLLKDGLLKTNSLLRLGLQGTKISDEGSVALAEYIADSTILLRIDLRENDIKTGGLMALSHALRVNSSVTRIDLDKDPKKEPGMKDYAEQQNRLLRDIVTFQQRNVQHALEREEQERVLLEEKAKAAAAAAAAAKEKENSIESSPSANGESFTVIGDEEAGNKDVDQEKDKKDAENSQLKNNGDTEKEDEMLDDIEDSSTNDDNDIDEFDAADGNEGEEDIKCLSRPNRLFTYTGLHPQESLDSPLISSTENPLHVTVSAPESVPETPPKSSTSNTDRRTLAVGSAPGEMILSPQYFPKQIARKIFSVSRVSEDPSWSQLSTSPTPPDPLSAGFDPLSVSSVPLISLSTSSSQPRASSPVTVPQRSGGMSAQHSSPTPPTSVSPSTSLLQDLADETVKHLVSPDEDMDVKSLLAQNVGPPCVVQVCDITKDNVESTKNLAQEFGDPAVESWEDSPNSASKTGAELLSTELVQPDTGSTSVTESSTSVLAPKSSHIDTDSCDTSESSAELLVSSLFSDPGSEGRPATCEVINTVVSRSELGGASEDLVKNLHPSEFESSSLSDEVFCPEDDDPDDISYASIIVDQPQEFPSAEPTEVSVSSASAEEKEDLEENAGDSSSCVLQTSVENKVDNDAVSTNLVKPVGTFSHQGAGDEACQFMQSSENVGLSPQWKHQAAAVDLLLENSTSSDLRNQNCSFSNTADEPGLVCLNNSNSPSLLQAEQPDLPPTSSEKEMYGLNHIVSESGDENKSSAPNVPDTSFENGDSAEGMVNMHSTTCDSIDIENVDVSLDEEPWFTVGADGNDTAEKAKESPKQPDFFTTLSMNGLTQELASALTSLDGTSTCYGDEEELDLRPHDEFERELDAMLALVQSDLPWPLKES